jgi:hypothetical protein
MVHFNVIVVACCKEIHEMYSVSVERIKLFQFNLLFVGSGKQSK